MQTKLNQISTLDKHIELSQYLIKTNGGESELLPLLLELKERRESDLKPADKFLVNHQNDQFRHMDSELHEIEDAEDVDHVIEEVIDLQMSCETMLAILGLNEQQRREARRKVIEKNRARGYYEVQI